MEPKEGQTLKDLCNSHIGFKFIGFRVEGQLSTFGSNEGPANVKISLKKGDEVIQNITSVEGGFFSFTPVMPGSYTIVPTDNVDAFDPEYNRLDIVVSKTSENRYPRALVVKGFNVSGTIKSLNQPLLAAHALIFSLDSSLTTDYKCEHSIFPNYAKNVYDNLTPFCAMETKENGKFEFVNIPFGTFIVKVLKESDGINYVAYPPFLQVEMRHSNVELRKSFEVKEFSIKGRVINAIGEGVPDVIIKIDGQETTKTNSTGEYLIEDLSESNYDIEAEAANMYLEPITNIHLSPFLNFIPNIVVTHYKICGSISIERIFLNSY